MALTTFGYKTEILYRVREEMLGTTFYWQAQSGANFTNAVEFLAKGVDATLAGVTDAFGSDVKLDCVKAAALGFEGFGWSFEQPMYKVGSALSVAIDETCHVNTTLLSALDEDTNKRIVNRNQVAGVGRDDVSNGSVSGDAIQAWFNLFNGWITGVEFGGLTFFPACGRYAAARWEFIELERFKVSPFVGTRIDRIKNRPNTGRKVANGAVPP